jgi:hypothetical protein
MGAYYLAFCDIARPEAKRYKNGERALMIAVIWQAFRDANSDRQDRANEAAEWLLTYGYVWAIVGLRMSRNAYDAALDRYLPAHL